MGRLAAGAALESALTERLGHVPRPVDRVVPCSTARKGGVLEKTGTASEQDSRPPFLGVLLSIRAIRPRPEASKQPTTRSDLS